MKSAITGVIFFGDSVLAGTGASDRELGCAKLVKSALSVPVSLRARNWNTSEDGLERLEEDVLRQRFLSHVIVLFGNNDCWLVGPNQPKISLMQFRKNMCSMIERIKRNGQVPLPCTLQLTDFKKFSAKFPELIEYEKEMGNESSHIQKQYSDSVKELAESCHVAYIDIRKELEPPPLETIASDGIHPTDLGHRIIADTILSFLKVADPSLTISVCQSNETKRAR